MDPRRRVGSLSGIQIPGIRPRPRGPRGSGRPGESVAHERGLRREEDALRELRLRARRDGARRGDSHRLARPLRLLDALAQRRDHSVFRLERVLDGDAARDLVRLVGSRRGALRADAVDDSLGVLQRDVGGARGAPELANQLAELLRRLLRVLAGNLLLQRRRDERERERRQAGRRHVVLGGRRSPRLEEVAFERDNLRTKRLGVLLRRGDARPLQSQLRRVLLRRRV
mmetsp:Transcript_3283/g.13201  ORF Transcript_3283/g.13201 Transcript_3283/m.13201 type:complete len:228 (-) Transcript_3283:1000-1683(-)